ncbi:ribonuclease P [Candidatus Micrarchaeota archaeon]|nr:ribonuclease P [Candidatus Micrarchaeota archaeon]
MRRGNKPGFLLQVVRERIDILFRLAEKEVKTHPERSRRYISLARKLGMKYNVRFSPKLKRRFCKKCGTLWVPGYNMKARLNSRKKMMEYRCECGAVRDFPLTLRKVNIV